jgi:uncharacterized membrane protein
MGNAIASQIVQLTPLIVAVIILLIALVLSLYWVRATHVESPSCSSRWFDDAELLLLSGLLLIAVGVIVGFVLLLVISSNTLALR